MKLITKEILDALPLLKDLEDPATGETKVPLKLFSPVGSATWFIMAIDSDTKEIDDNTILYGICHIHETELGSVSLGELRNTILPMGLKIERDISWDINKNLFDANNYLKRNGYGNVDWMLRKEVG